MNAGRWECIASDMPTLAQGAPRCLAQRGKLASTSWGLQSKVAPMAPEPQRSHERTRRVSAARAVPLAYARQPSTRLHTPAGCARMPAPAPTPTRPRQSTRAWLHLLSHASAPAQDQAGTRECNKPAHTNARASATPRRARRPRSSQGPRVRAQLAPTRAGMSGRPPCARVARRLPPPHINAPPTLHRGRPVARVLRSPWSDRDLCGHLGSPERQRGDSNLGSRLGSPRSPLNHTDPPQPLKWPQPKGSP